MEFNPVYYKFLNYLRTFTFHCKVEIKNVRKFLSKNTEECIYANDCIRDLVELMVPNNTKQGDYPLKSFINDIENNIKHFDNRYAEKFMKILNKNSVIAQEMTTHGHFISTMEKMFETTLKPRTESELMLIKSLNVNLEFKTASELRYISRYIRHLISNDPKDRHLQINNVFFHNFYDDVKRYLDIIGKQELNIPADLSNLPNFLETVVNSNLSIDEQNYIFNILFCYEFL